MEKKVKKELSKESVKIANELLKNLSLNEALAVLKMAKVLIKAYKNRRA